MALHILQGGTTAGGRLGEAFGTGIASLADHKVKQIQARNGLRALLPEDQYSNEQVDQLSNLAADNPQMLQQIAKQTLVSNKENKQKYIDSANKSWNTNFDKSLDIANKMEDIAGQMETLLASGKVKSGLLGRATPEFMLNDESRTFEALSNELASLIASNSGVATNFKIKLAQSMKPNITQPKKTQMQLLQNVRKQAGKILSKAEIRDNLIASNNGMQPQNIGSLVEKAYKDQKISKSSMGTQPSNNKRETIPPQEISETIDELIKGKASPGISVDFDNGVRLYWDGKELVEENPLGA